MIEYAAKRQSQVEGSKFLNIRDKTGKQKNRKECLTAIMTSMLMLLMHGRVLLLVLRLLLLLLRCRSC
jgi:hypothetical protein